MQGPISKSVFYRAWLAGKFGNRQRTWESLSQLASSDYHGLVSIRSKIPGGPCWYNIESDDLRQGSMASNNLVFFSESLPDEHLVIQGSVHRSERGLVLEYCLEKNIKFRRAMMNDRMKRAERTQALLLLMNLLDPNSYDDINELLDTYPNAIVEFATFSVNVGTLKRPTVIFEVREY